MKSKFTALALVILLLIPTGVAVGSYFMTNIAPLSAGIIDTIGISDIDGTSFILKKEDASPVAADMFAAIIDANSRSEIAVGGLPEPLQGTKFYALSFHGLEKTLNYQYYFKANSADAYFCDDKGIAYKLPTDFVNKFHSSDYAISLYETAHAPVLNVAGKYTVAADTMSWQYKLTDGQFSDKSIIPTETTAGDYFIDGRISLDFTYQPDVINVKITDGNTVVFDNEYSKMTDLSFDKETTVKVELSASWYKDDVRNYYGEAKYTFNADIPAPADFAINKAKIEPGDFILVSVSNVYDLSKVQFSCEPSIQYTPKFFLDGTTARALVPVSYELDGGNYSMTMSYGAESKTIDVTVEDKTFKRVPMNISKATEKATRTDATLAAFEETLKPIVTDKVSSTLYFKDGGKFYDYTVDTKGFAIAIGIGHTKVISDTGTSYRHNGVDFKVTTGKDVAAVMDGEVVFVGETTLSGNLVVIEHGLGLKSWYAHLGNMTVKVGDKVKKGDNIAVTGNTGFTNGTTLHLGLSVYDVPVSIYPLWENEGLTVVDPK
ncbi:MAG: M23 family metallopeptidase [Clostridia bacterium]|nr:M23 family metallopeptidase [Clostridia bacterium]